MCYTVFVAFNVFLLLLGSVDCKGYRRRGSFPAPQIDYETPSLPTLRRSGYELPSLLTPLDEDPDIDDGDICSDQVNTELAKIRADIRAVKSLVEGLRKKLDPDFKPEETEESTAQPIQCPEGFDYLPEARGCYRVIAEEHDWSSAQEQCQNLDANLISIESREESEDVTKYLKKMFASRSFRTRGICSRPGQPAGHAAFWTSGQRVNTSDCSSEFVWKTAGNRMAPFSYTQWLRGQPNCWGRDARCAEFLLGRRSAWKDVNCNVRSCSLCEYVLN